MTLGAAVDLIVAKAILVPSSSAPGPVREAAVRARFELLLIMMRKRDRVIGFRQSVYPDHGSVAGQVVSSYSQPCPTGPSCSVVFKALVLKADPYYPRWSIGSSSDRSDIGCSKRHKCRWLRPLQWIFRTIVKHRVVCACRRKPSRALLDADVCRLHFDEVVGQQCEDFGREESISDYPRFTVASLFIYFLVS